MALFLFGLLVTVRGGLQPGGGRWPATTGSLVINKVSLIQPLPLAVPRPASRACRASRQLTFANWFGGVYQDEKNFFAQFAIDADTYRELYTEFLVPDDQWQAFLADKAGCIAGQATAERFGWKIGDRIPIRGAIYPGNWEFNLRGIYTGARPRTTSPSSGSSWNYLEEKVPPVRARASSAGTPCASPTRTTRCAVAKAHRRASSRTRPGRRAPRPRRRSWPRRS